MRSVRAAGIIQQTVDEFLKYQVAARVLAQVGAMEQPAKVLHMAVEITRHQHLGILGQMHQPTPPTWQGVAVREAM